MGIEQNERVEELFLIVGDWVRETSKIWFYALVVVLVGAIPLQMFLKLIFEQTLISSITPLKVTYVEVAKNPLTIIDRKIFDLGDSTYSGYVRIKNNNSEWGVPVQKYRVEFKTSAGSFITGYDNVTFILPSTDKVVVFPRFSADKVPSRLDFTLGETNFIRPPGLPTLELEIQRRSMDLQVNQSIINAVIVNRTPFKLSKVDLPVLLYDKNNSIIGANYTNINDLNSAEYRSFQYVWYNRINNVARIEIIPEINFYDRDIFLTEPGQNPFDNLNGNSQ